jgi:cell cycle checkpoint protein
MTRPPAKRQRPLIPSDDDEPLAKAQQTPTGLFTGAKTALPERKSDKFNSTPKRPKTKAAINGSPRSSPKKANRGVREEKGNKSLNSFFARATEEQRWARDEKTVLTGAEDVEIGDAIEDDSLDEALVDMADRQGNENKVLDRRKSPVVPSSKAEVSHALRDRRDSSQRFAKQAKTMSDRTGIRSPGQDADNSHQVWAERFAPTCLEELAVHKKKVTDVQNWLASVLHGRDQRVCEPPMRAFKKGLILTDHRSDYLF